MKDKIIDFITSGEKELKFDTMLPISEIEKILTSMGFDEFDTIDATNGWQVDFWYYIEHRVFGGYYLSGSLWYGDFVLKRD